jgi:hypothetical protein
MTSILLSPVALTIVIVMAGGELLPLAIFVGVLFLASHALPSRPACSRSGSRPRSLRRS